MQEGGSAPRVNRLKDATASFDQAISLDRITTTPGENRGATLAQTHQYTDALASLARALVLKPDDATALLNYATAHYGNGNRREALAAIKRFLRRFHGPRGRFLQVMWTLPIISHSEEEAIASRAAYEASLRSLIDDLDGIADLGTFAEGIGIAQPFYLTYQGQNDRELQKLYGSLVSRIMAHRYRAPPALPAPPHKTDRVRIGFVSGFFHRRVLWRMAVKGWVSQLDRRRFEVFGYYTGNVHDDDTEDAIAMCDRFVRGPMTGDRWRHAILSDAPHVLIYSEVGMDPMAARLAAQRLAPVQCNSSGHPVSAACRR